MHHGRAHIQFVSPARRLLTWRGHGTFVFSYLPEGHLRSPIIFLPIPKFFLISADASQQEMFQDATAHTPKDPSRIA